MLRREDAGIPSNDRPRRSREARTRRHWIQALFSLGTLAAAAACSMAVDADRRQCSTAKDCVGHGLSAEAVCVANVCTEPLTTVSDAGDAGAVDAEPVDPIWGCLGKLPELPAEEPAEPVRFITGFQNVISTERLAGLPVRACKTSDPDCAQPLEGAATVADEKGVVGVPLYSGFRGFLEVAPTAQFSDIMPSLVQVLPVPDKRSPDGGIRVTWGLLTKAQVEFISATAGKQIKPEYGHVFFFATDCSGSPVADVIARSETVTADTYTFYTDSAGTPSLTQPKTTSSGNGGYLNLPVGKVTLNLAREGGQPVASQTVIVRKGGITYLNFGPSP